MGCNVNVSTFDKRATLHAIDTVAKRLVDLVQGAPNLDLPVQACPGWTVAQAFAHVVTVAPRYLHGARREGESIRGLVAPADGLYGQFVRTARDHVRPRRGPRG